MAAPPYRGDARFIKPGIYDGPRPKLEDLIVKDEGDPREDKPWPEDEDCLGCDKHKDGPHRFGCAIGGKRQTKLDAYLEEGKLIAKEVDGWPEWKKMGFISSKKD